MLGDGPVKLISTRWDSLGAVRQACSARALPRHGARTFDSEYTHLVEWPHPASQSERYRTSAPAGTAARTPSDSAKVSSTAAMASVCSGAPTVRRTWQARSGVRK